MPLHKILIIVTTFTWGLFSNVNGKAQDTVQWQNPTVSYSFGNSVMVEADLISTIPITSAEAVLSPQGFSNAIVTEALVDSSNHVVAQFHLAEDTSLRAFNEINYYFFVTLSNGEQVATPEASFIYEDDRFRWNTLDRPPFRVNWFEGNAEFGQLILDTANNALSSSSQFLSLPPLNPINIYVYPDQALLQQALQISNQTWVAGHTDPTARVILASIQPGPEQNLEIERQISHELMHIRLYDQLGENYYNLPMWLSEGIASNGELFPNPDHTSILKNALDNNALIPLQDLCFAFPQDPQKVALAYAEADSFVGFIYQEYGASSLQQLYHDYAQGAECNTGAKNATNLTLTQLELKWKDESLNAATFLTLLGASVPFAFLISFSLITPIVLIYFYYRKSQK